MNCKYCGKEIENDSIYCEYCGKGVKSIDVSSQIEDTTFSTEVTDEDLASAIEDEHGVLYSKDGSRLLKCANKNLREYSIIKGTKVVCNQAFRECKHLETIVLPNSVETFGFGAFSSCEALISIEFPKGLKSIGNLAFGACKSIESLKLPDGLESIGDSAFHSCAIN